jgi:hypothetical protein
VRSAIDRFWRENHYPPTVRDLMRMTGISSTSAVRYHLVKLADVRIAKRGRIIPKWVDDVLTWKASE